MVNIWGRTDKSEEESAGHFSFKVPSLGPFESKEATAPVTTKLKAYELPDWQKFPQTCKSLRRRGTSQ